MPCGLRRLRAAPARGLSPGADRMTLIGLANCPTTTIEPGAADWGWGAGCLNFVTRGIDLGAGETRPIAIGDQALKQCGMLMQQPAGFPVGFVLKSGRLRQVDLSHSRLAVAQKRGLVGGSPNLNSGARGTAAAAANRQVLPTGDAHASPLRTTRRGPGQASHKGSVQGKQPKAFGPFTRTGPTRWGLGSAGDDGLGTTLE